MAAFLLVLIIGFVAYRAFGSYQSLQHGFWRGFAKSIGLKLLGSHLPESFPDRSSTLPSFRRVRNCIYGERFGEEVIVFQYWRFWAVNIGVTGLPTGPARWNTVVAVRQKHPERNKTESFPGYVIARADGWLVARGGLFSYKPSTSEIVDAWDFLRTTSKDDLEATASVSDGIVIRPQHRRPRARLQGRPDRLG